MSCCCCVRLLLPALFAFHGLPVLETRLRDGAQLYSRGTLRTNRLSSLLQAKIQLARESRWAIATPMKRKDLPYEFPM
jgi:hypothetical protein